MTELSAAQPASGTRRLLEVAREWPWGLAVVTDPGSNELVPTVLNVDGIAPGRSIVAASIQHAVNGEAVAEVWNGQPLGDLVCVYDGEFVTVCGAVIVGDAAYEQHSPVEIGEGAHRLRVFVSERESPARVVLAFDRPARAD